VPADDVALLTLTSRRRVARTPIGPEQAPRLAVIRSAELNAAAQNLWRKIIFSPRAPWTSGFFQNDGRNFEHLGRHRDPPDMVRVISALFRPDIVINGWGGRSQRPRQSSSPQDFLVPKAVELAADPKAYPDQTKEGVSPVERSVCFLQQGGPRRRWRNRHSAGKMMFRPVWGESYGEIGRAGFCQSALAGSGRIHEFRIFLRRPASVQTFRRRKILTPR